MKSYPSIQHRVNSEINVYAFDKLDGTQVRAEWRPKNGFSKLGYKLRLLDPNCTFMGPAHHLFHRDWPDVLEKIFKKQRWTGKTMRVTCFFEFHGQHSFAGQHRKDDNHRLTLFDVAIFKQGILPPRDFLKIFGHLDVPKVLHRGRVNKEFINSVRNSALEGMTFEGVVCKGKRPGKRAEVPVMFKIKSQAWLEKLKECCGEDHKKFEMLQ